MIYYSIELMKCNLIVIWITWRFSNFNKRSYECFARLMNYLYFTYMFFSSFLFIFYSVLYAGHRGTISVYLRAPGPSNHLMALLRPSWTLRRPGPVQEPSPRCGRRGKFHRWKEYSTPLRCCCGKANAWPRTTNACPYTCTYACARGHS